MIPVAVSVPEMIDIEIKMEASKWAFGKIAGKARG